MNQRIFRFIRVDYLYGMFYKFHVEGAIVVIYAFPVFIIKFFLLLKLSQLFIIKFIFVIISFWRHTFQ